MSSPKMSNVTGLTIKLIYIEYLFHGSTFTIVSISSRSGLGPNDDKLFLESIPLKTYMGNAGKLSDKS